MKWLNYIGVCTFVFGGLSVQAQELEADIQLRPRYEYRHGFKDFLSEGEKPASFISQRSRINLMFKQDSLKVYFSAQNVGVWGETPIASPTDVNGTSIHEAWASYNFQHNISAKFGRQVISYDNQRIFGGSDWAQQGQSHDALLLQYNSAKHRLDLGFALNNVSETLKKEPYSVANYKAMQYLWYHTQLNALQISFLFLNTGYEFEKNTDDFKTEYLQTWGTYLAYQKNKFDVNAGFYGQSGKTNGNTKQAWYAGLELGYQWDNSFSSKLGYEFLSGKSQDDTSFKNKSFVPLFGTNHIFNGLMDYFYAGNHQNSVGLQDLYVKLNLKQNKWTFGLHPHVFLSANKIYDAEAQKIDSYLGTELDFIADYQLHKDIKISAGYSQLFASKSLEALKGAANNRSNQWAWLMVSVQPTLFKTKK